MGKIHIPSLVDEYGNSLEDISVENLSSTVVKYHYYMDTDTDQFYLAKFMETNKENRKTYIAIAITILFGGTITALHQAIDRFYVPRATTLSNVLLLIALFIGVSFFTFRFIKASKKKHEPTDYRPVSLSDKQKKSLLKNALQTNERAEPILAVLLLVGLGTSIGFIFTSMSILYGFTSLAIFLVVLFIPNEETRTQNKIFKERLAQNK